MISAAKEASHRRRSSDEIVTMSLIKMIEIILILFLLLTGSFKLFFWPSKGKK